MRSAKVNDVWRKCFNRQYSTFVKSINLDGYKGFEEITFSPGISVVCGLNGVGKSTVLSAISALTNEETNSQKKMQISDSMIQGVIAFNNREYNCSNETGKRLVDQIDGCDEVSVYVDAMQAINILTTFSLKRIWMS